MKLKLQFPLFTNCLENLRAVERGRRRRRRVERGRRRRVERVERERRRRVERGRRSRVERGRWSVER